MAKSTDRTLELIHAMRRHFFVWLDMQEFLSDLDSTLVLLDESYAEIGSAFAHNLNALFSMVTLPFRLAASGVHAVRHGLFAVAERIKSRGIQPADGESRPSLEARRDQYAEGRAKKRMSQFASSREGIDALIADVCTFLLKTAQDNEGALAASELVLQGTVLAWAAFEVLARDVFVAYLNRNPETAGLLFGEARTRKVLNLTKIRLEDLAERGFDLSGSMGTLICRQQDMSDLRTVKAVYTTIFPKQEGLRRKLNDPLLWLLNQQRHLVVHRRAVIDEQYVNNTGAKEATGSLLRIDPVRLEEYLRVVRDAGCAVLRAVAEGESSS